MLLSQPPEKMNQWIKRKFPFTVSTSVKNETCCHEHSSFPVSSSLKNKTNPPLIESIFSFNLVNGPSFHPTISN